MYMSCSLFLERIWDSKTIPRKRAFFVGGGDIFAKEVCSKILVDRLCDKTKMAVADGKNIDKLASSLFRYSAFDGVNSLVVRLHNASNADMHPALVDWAKTKYLIFVDVGEDLPSGKPLYDWIKENGLVVNCEEVREYSEEMRIMVSGMFKAFGKVPPEDTVREIIARTGNSVMMASNLVNLICLSDYPMTPDSVKRISDFQRRDDVFELVASLAMKKAEKVFLIMNSLMERGESPRLILDRLAYIFGNIWSVLKMPKGERIPWQIQGVLSVNSHEARQLAFCQKLYNPDSAMRIYKLVMEAYGWVLCKGYSPSLAFSILMIDIIENG